MGRLGRGPAAAEPSGGDGDGTVAADDLRQVAVHAVRLLRLLSFQDFCGLRVKRDLLHEMGRLERLEAATLQTYDAPGAV